MHIHILGICGTFMAGIAALAKANGHKVTGCDENIYPPMSTQLENLGIEIIDGYDPHQLELKPDKYVIGNVISRGNKLMEEILNKHLNFISGPQWLNENILFNKWVLAVAGTHGKTSTTAMLLWILEDCGIAPGFLIGGIPNNFGISARLPIASDKNIPSFFVIEADEYDTAFFDKRSKFSHYYPKTLVLNNLEFDHADIFDNLEHIEKHFHHLVKTIPHEGRILINSESESLKKVLDQGSWSEIEFFGKGNKWEYCQTDETLSTFTVLLDKKIQGVVNWNLIGHHNRMNGLAAISAAHHVGILPSEAIKALNSFAGVKKRMELLKFHKGIEIYDDFAHHPTAIRTTLEGVRKMNNIGRIIAVIEPRSNTMKLGSMKNDLLKSLNEADLIYCYTKQISWNSKELFEQRENAMLYEDIDELADSIAKKVMSGDKLIFMSNGDFGGIQRKVIRLITRK
jgi:UDP-N-acetylmuramate: L-alanyl-gamma-D-glutamyl-meso-diaminopimelate ligase